MFNHKDKNVSKFFVLFIVLYILHVLFADDLFDFTTLFNGKYRVDTSIMIRKTLKLTYVSFLTLGLYFENRTNETYLIALLFCSISIIGYIVKFSHQRYYKHQIVNHSLLLLPLLFIDYRKNSSFKITFITYIAIFYLVILKIMANEIYK